MSLKKALSQTNEQTKYAVYGWIRNEERKLQLSHIPTIITSICVLYFREEDFFEFAGDNVANPNGRSTSPLSDKMDRVFTCLNFLNDAGTFFGFS